MNVLSQPDYIREMKNAHYVSYILNDNSMFMTTEYKVLKTKEKDGLIKCSKVLYNGKIKLLYHTDGRKTLETMMQTADSDTFLTILANLIGVIIGIKNNGFLHCRNVDYSLDKVFVDINTLGVSVIYLPISNADENQMYFENEFRTELIKIISSSTMSGDSKINNVSTQLVNGALSLEELHQQICKECKNISKGGQSQEEKSKPGVIADVEVQTGPRMILTAMNTRIPFSLNVNKSEYVIGKNTASVDGVISFNNAVSRVHCKIICQNGLYYIMDMGSANGTYINDAKVMSQQYYPVKNGDIIRLANSEFRVSM